MDTSSKRGGSTASRAAYQSPLREEQALQTRNRILDAFAEHVAAEGWEDFSIARVADAARVSEPTVYRHFPNRDALLQGLAARVDEKLASPDLPSAVSELPATARLLFERFQANAALVRAATRVGVARHIRERKQAARDRRVMSSLDDTFAHLSAEDALAIKAFVRVIVSADAWALTTGRLGAEPAAAGRAVEWLMRAILESAARDAKTSRRSASGTPKNRGKKKP